MSAALLTLTDGVFLRNNGVLSELSGDHWIGADRDLLD
jgi:hypothetical protein